MTLLGILATIALVLTATMFATRQAMLGFACAMFWMMVGAQAYTLSTGAWADLYFYLFFGGGFGMTAFTALAAFGLREKRDTIADESMERDEPYIDEDKESEDKFNEYFSTEPEHNESSRSVALRKRAADRRKKLRPGDDGK